MLPTLWQYSVLAFPIKLFTTKIQLAYEGTEQSWSSKFIQNTVRFFFNNFPPQVEKSCCVRLTVSEFF